MGGWDGLIAKILKRPGEEPLIEEWRESEKQLLRSLDRNSGMAHDAYLNVKVLVGRLARQNDDLHARVARIEKFLSEVGNDDEDTN